MLYVSLQANQYTHLCRLCRVLVLVRRDEMVNFTVLIMMKTTIPAGSMTSQVAGYWLLAKIPKDSTSIRRVSPFLVHVFVNASHGCQY